MKQKELNSVRALTRETHRSLRSDMVAVGVSLALLAAGLVFLKGLVGGGQWAEAGYALSVTGLFILLYALCHLALTLEHLTALREVVDDLGWDYTTEEIIFENRKKNESILP